MIIGFALAVLVVPVLAIGTVRTEVVVRGEMLVIKRWLLPGCSVDTATLPTGLAVTHQAPPLGKPHWWVEILHNGVRVDAIRYESRADAIADAEDLQSLFPAIERIESEESP